MDKRSLMICPKCNTFSNHLENSVECIDIQERQGKEEIKPCPKCGSKNPIHVPDSTACKVLSRKDFSDCLVKSGAQEVLDLELLQSEVQAWQIRNFPNEDAARQLFGVVEEVGELCHFILKEMQGIKEAVDEAGKRVSVENHIKDAIGDTVIFLMNFCTHKQLSFESCVLETWREVKQRDYIKYPKNGKTV